MKFESWGDGSLPRSTAKVPIASPLTLRVKRWGTAFFLKGSSHSIAWLKPWLSYGVRRLVFVSLSWL